MSAPESGAPPLPPERPRGHRPIRCCPEPDCNRARPFGLYLGDFEPRSVFLATDYREQPGKPGHYVATRKHDITEQLREFIRRNPEWVRAVLRSRM